MALLDNLHFDMRSIQSQLFSIMEATRNLNKQIKLPLLKQLSEHKLPSLTKIDSLKRESSSQNLINQSFRNIFKPKNAEENSTAGKTLLKSGGCFNKASAACKIDSNEMADCNKNVKLLRKANTLCHLAKQNLKGVAQFNEQEKVKPSKQIGQALPETSNTSDSNSTPDEELRQSLSQFYQSHLVTGVTLKAIDVQQD